ncbi:unnamed protein product [Malus baccata var. baccata]
MASTVKEASGARARLQIYSTSDTINFLESPFFAEKYVKNARKYWDVFYKRHQDKFFKSRHYLDKEWGKYFSVSEELCWRYIWTGAGRKVILEVGCGAGNYFTVFPLVAMYADVFVHACDFSTTAVNLVKTHKDLVDTRVSAFVCDLTIDDLSKQVSSSSVDIITMIFVLSAVSPEKMSINLWIPLPQPNGCALFRDYATGDLAQERLNCKDQKISENFYVRGDGTESFTSTRSYIELLFTFFLHAFYFSNELLTSLFEENGFDAEELDLCCKQVENRSTELVMNQRCVQAVFRLSDDTNSSTKTEAETEVDHLGQEKIVLEVNEKILKKPVNDLEVDISDGVVMEMSGVLPSNDNEVIELGLGDLTFKIEVLSKVDQRTCKSTGLMLWESARFMASADISGQTDYKKIRVGNRDHIEAIKEANSQGFDIILGTDVTYVAEAILPLFQTAKELISSDRSTAEDSEPPSILSAAFKFGFKLVGKWPIEIPTSSQSIIKSSFMVRTSEHVQRGALPYPVLPHGAEFF